MWWLRNKKIFFDNALLCKGTISKKAKVEVIGQSKSMVLYVRKNKTLSDVSVVRHLPLVLEVQGSIPARGDENFVVRSRFL